MKNYYVEYYTKDGSKMGMTISAYNETEANLLARNLPNFLMLAQCVKEV